MDRKIAGLLGAAAALTAMTGAQAAPVQSTNSARATNYGDLLEPIPNALQQLKADDARRAEASGTEVAQVVVGVGRHRYWRRRYHHHHHHHHHHHQYW